MWSDDIDALLLKARSGDAAGQAELIRALEEDLRAFVALHASDQAMVDAVCDAVWASGRRALQEAIQPSGAPQAGLWMGRTSGESGSVVVKMLRDPALVRLRQDLASVVQQALGAQDTLRHLIAQDGLEALPDDSAGVAAVPQLIRDRLGRLPPTANELLAKRYAQGQTLAQIAFAQGRDAAELASALAMARSAADWQSGGAMLFDPGDHELPLLIEEYIDGTITYDVRLRFADSLLGDITRAACFIRQVRISLVLAAFSQRPRAPEPLPVAEPPGPRPGTRPTGPATGVPAQQEPHRAQTASARLARSAPAGSGRRQVMIVGAALLMLALIAGGVAALARTPAAPHATPAARGGDGSAGPPTSSAATAAQKPAEPAPAVVRAPAPAPTGPMAARIASGQATIIRTGDRELVKAGAELPAGTALETDSGPVVLGLSLGRTLTLGVNSRARGLTLGDGQEEVLDLERGQAGIDGPSAAHAVAVRVLHALAIGNGAAFTVTTTDDGMRLDVARGMVKVLRSGLGPVVVRDHRVAVVHDRGDITLDSSGTFVTGIKLGGPGLVVDGRRWKSQLQAQSDGLAVSHGAVARADTLRDVDAALRPLLDPALTDAVELDLAVPDGTYDVAGWVVGPPGGDAGRLSAGTGTADNDEPGIGPHGWLRLQPLRVEAVRSRLHLSYRCPVQQLLAGLELYAIDTGPLPPAVFLTAPGADQALAAPATLLLAAEAYAPGSALHAVEFLVDGVKLGEAAAPPYTLPWAVQAPGPHALTARAISGNGLSATTVPTVVTVAAGGQPALLLTLVQDGATTTGAASLILNAVPDHLDGTIAKVEFLSDGARIGEAVAPPFTLRWGEAAPGAHLVTALAHLAGGGSLLSETLKVVVQPPANPPLSAVIESPEDGSQLAENGHLSIRVRAASREGRVARVDYFADDQKVGESSSAPFSYVWTRATPGLHRLRVVATDEHGGSVPSEVVTVLMGKNVPFVLARGVHLGGEPVDIDGFHWLGQDEALALGLTVKGARPVAELGLQAPTAEPGLAALLRAGLQSDGEELALSQSLPSGIYQVSLWLSVAKAGAGQPFELEVQGVKQSLSSGRMGRSAWARYGPFTVRVANQALSVVLRAGSRTALPRLHGLALAAPLAGSAPAPRPLVELLFDNVNGALTPNTGLASAIAPIATIAAEGPQRSLIASPGGGSGSMDFGTAFRPAAIDVAGLAPALRGLKSFTITAWLNNRVARENGGGDRIVNWTRDGGDGAELVYHDDGSIQLAINSLVDGPGAARRSSPGLISSNDGVPLDNWRFIAVVYDATQAAKQVRYHIGSGTQRAVLDSAVDLARGPVGANVAAELSIGHTFPAFRKPGADRMYRGIIDQVRIWGSASDGSGALSPEQIISVQAAANPAALQVAFDRGDQTVAAGLAMWLHSAAGVTSLAGRVGAWDDLTGKHHDLVQNADGQRPLLVDGKGAVAPVLSCTGEQHLEISGAAGLDPETFTLMAWVRQDRFAHDGDLRRWAVGKNGNETDAGHFSLFTRGGAAGAYLNLGGDIHLLELSSAAGTMHELTWHLLAMTYDGERFALHLDGGRVGEKQARTKRSPGGGAFTVGRRPDNFGSWDGLVSEVRLYDRALSDAEIQLIERVTRARYFNGGAQAAPAP